jgi:hypothetical protein
LDQGNGRGCCFGLRESRNTAEHGKDCRDDEERGGEPARSGRLPSRERVRPAVPAAVEKQCGQQGVHGEFHRLRSAAETQDGRPTRQPTFLQAVFSSSRTMQQNDRGKPSLKQRVG